MLSVFGHREYESKLGKLPKVTKLEIANSSWNPDNLAPEPVVLTNMNSSKLPPQKNTDVQFITKYWFSKSINISYVYWLSNTT